jgi:hypothetical protein
MTTQSGIGVLVVVVSDVRVVDEGAGKPVGGAPHAITFSDRGGCDRGDDGTSIGTTQRLYRTT